MLAQENYILIFFYIWNISRYTSSALVSFYSSRPQKFENYKIKSLKNETCEQLAKCMAPWAIVLKIPDPLYGSLKNFLTVIHVFAIEVSKWQRTNIDCLSIYLKLVQLVWL